MRISVNDTATYVAFIDINDEPMSAGEAVPYGEPTQRNISVQCQVTARLMPPPDNSLQVADIGNTTRAFLPDGLLNWSWPVTALKPGHHDLRLVIQPAIASGPSIFQGDPVTQSVTLVTDINVDATPMQDVAYWWTNNWPSIVSITAAIGAGLVGFLKWSGSLVDAWRKAKATWRPGEAPRADRSQSRQDDSTGYM
jgi:hypothetical protein